MAKQGIFITFEGGEGTGKSTQIGLLAKRFQEAGRRVRVMREPGGTEFGEEVRRILKTAAYNERLTPVAELLLFAASRAQLIAEAVRPALATGEIVLCDRFTDSTIAYQGAGRGLPEEAIMALNDLATDGFVADLTILLDLPVSEGLARASRRAAGGGAGSRAQAQSVQADSAAVASSGCGSAQNRVPAAHDPIEAMPANFHERIRAAYHRIAMNDTRRILVVDAARPIETIAAEIWENVCNRLRERI